MPELEPNLPLNRFRTPCADKNDRLGWKAGFSLELEGVCLGVRTNDPAYLPTLRACLPPHAVPSEIREVDVLLSFLKGGSTQRKG